MSQIRMLVSNEPLNKQLRDEYYKVPDNQITGAIQLKTNQMKSNLTKKPTRRE